MRMPLASSQLHSLMAQSKKYLAKACTQEGEREARKLEGALGGKTTGEGERPWGMDTAYPAGRPRVAVYGCRRMADVRNSSSGEVWSGDRDRDGGWWWE